MGSVPQYGYFQMTAELPTGAGLWPAFWLEPVNGTSACEIDIFEAPFNNPTLIQVIAAWRQRVHHRTSHRPKLFDKLQYLRCKLVAQTITYYVNGQVIGSTPTPASCNTPALSSPIWRSAVSHGHGPARQIRRTPGRRT